MAKKETHIPAIIDTPEALEAGSLLSQIHSGTSDPDASRSCRKLPPWFLQNPAEASEPSAGQPTPLHPWKCRNPDLPEI